VYNLLREDINEVRDYKGEDKTKNYPELLEYALTASRNNHQLKRVVYNLLREDINEVRDYKGDGSSFCGADFPVLCS